MLYRNFQIDYYIVLLNSIYERIIHFMSFKKKFLVKNRTASLGILSHFSHTKSETASLGIIARLFQYKI